MSTRSSLAYIEYPRKTGSLHIYFQMADCKYYIRDEEGGEVELPKDVAKDFAKILNDKYKHLALVNPMREEWEKKQGKKDEEGKCVHYLPMNALDIACGQLMDKRGSGSHYPEYTSEKEKVTCEKCRATKIFRE